MPTSERIPWESVREYRTGTWRIEPDGRMHVRVSDGMGGRRRRWIPRRTVEKLGPKQRAKLAEATIAELQAEVDAGLPPQQSRSTLGAFLRDWLARRMTAGQRIRGRGKVRDATVRHYAAIVANHIEPALGTIPLRKLRRYHVQAWIERMEGNPQTIVDRYGVLRNALSAAVIDGHLAANPADGVVLPELRPREVPTLSGAQVRALLDGTQGEPLHALWAVMLAGALRVSEALGLAWDDWEGERLYVRGQLVRVPGEFSPKDEHGHRHRLTPGRWAIGPTKAPRKREYLLLPAWAVEALEAHRRAQALARTPETRYFGMMFLTAAGTPWYARHVLIALYAAEKRLGLPHAWSHALRHSGATLLAEEGVPEDVRMARMGHSAALTARRYAHIGDPQDRRAAEALERAVGGAG